MKRTGLPYDMGEMDEIKNNGAIVDMSDINFPGIPTEKIQRTTFIFFRNTGFDVKLDFSKCSYKDKEAFLLAYLNENIDVKQSEFATSYTKILNYAAGNNINTDCILTDQEIVEFIKSNSELVTTLLQFSISLPVFAMFYFSLNAEVYDLSDFKKTDNTINDNFLHVITTEGFISLLDNEVNVEPLFYNKLFTFENEKLLAAVQTLPFFSILYGLCMEESEMWEKMIKESDGIINGSDNEVYGGE